MRPLRTALTAAALAAAPLGAQQPTTPSATPTSAGTRAGSFELSVPSIMRGPELVGREPQQVRWSADGRWLYFRWLPPGTDWRETPRPYRVRAAGGAAPERVSDAALDSVAPMLEEGSLSQDRRLRAVAWRGDIYVVDQRRGAVRRLTQTVEDENTPHFSADGRRVYFVRGNNVFSIELDGGLVRQLTDVRTGPAPKDSAKAEGQRGQLEAEQRALFEVVRDRLRADSISKAEQRARDSAKPKPLYLEKGERIGEIAVAPNGRALIVVTRMDADKALPTKIPNYVTASGYTEEINARTKVGDEQATGRVILVNLPQGTSRFLRVVPDDTLKAPAYSNLLGWNASGTAALLFTVSRDFKTRWLQTVGGDSGAIKVIDVLRDSAWVGGPCFGCGGWYDGGRRLWYISEADGWAHLYTMAADGSDRRQLTKGEWEVEDVQLSPDERSFLLHTSESSPFERHVYRMPVTGGARVRLTTRAGGHTAVPSPDWSMLADVYSTSNRPPELFVMRAAPGAAMTQLTTSPTAEWLGFNWLQPEIVRVPASDGVGVPARIYRPQQLGATPNGAAVIFVHGAGYLHNVHNFWSTYYREYMFHHVLASRGYVVLDIDYRGSAGYGRDWRTAIYRHMGGRDLQDQVDGSRYLAKELGIDPERVGIYGGSYGGFITLMALFNEAEHFGAGAALRSVTDWAHYNHPYTARILNTPQTDTVSYHQSSPIFFAQGLKDPLLMAHGMVDVNVHFQDIVRLSQRLIELGKTDWELAVYPVEDHGFVRPSSWTDEYRRIMELFDRTIGRQPTSRAATGGTN